MAIIISSRTAFTQLQCRVGLIVSSPPGRGEKKVLLVVGPKNRDVDRFWLNINIHGPQRIN